MFAISVLSNNFISIKLLNFTNVNYTVHQRTSIHHLRQPSSSQENFIINQSVDQLLLLLLDLFISHMPSLPGFHGNLSVKTTELPTGDFELTTKILDSNKKKKIDKTES